MTMTISGDGSITGLVAGGLPDATVTQAEVATGVAGTGPAFSAYGSVATSLTAGTVTKVNFQTERFDTASNFASSRFTPTVAGYYQINSCVTIAPAIGISIVYIFKNSTEYNRGQRIDNSSTLGLLIADCVYLNGTTDYVEIYAVTQGNTITEAGVTTWISGFLARAA